MRVRGSHIEREKLRKHLAKQAAIWGNLQHDLGTLLQVPEAKGQRQQVGCTLSALLAYDTLVTNADWLGCDGICAPCSGAGACCASHSRANGQEASAAQYQPRGNAACVQEVPADAELADPVTARNPPSQQRPCLCACMPAANQL